MWKVRQPTSRTAPRAPDRKPGFKMVWRAVLIAMLVVTFATTEQAMSQARTDWGDPDLQGIWSNATLTPLERPDQIAEQEFLTEAEAIEFEKAGIELTVLNPFDFEVPLSGELNEVWLEPGPVLRSRRTSLVIDPQDGKLPFTPEGRKRRDSAIARIFSLVADSWEDRHVSERCLFTGTLFVPNPFYLNNHQIFQSRDTIAILSEDAVGLRLIHLASEAQEESIDGFSRGWWDGDTLVVETTHIRPDVPGRNAIGPHAIVLSEGTTITKRFTRVSDRELVYHYTVEDEALYTTAWSGEFSMTRFDFPIFEYACHEGNYSMPVILRGGQAQAARRAAAE